MIKLINRMLNRVLEIWKDNRVEDMHSKLMFVNLCCPGSLPEHKLLLVDTLCSAQVLILPRSLM